MVSLYYGDCLDKMKSIADKSIDLIICDLPFGCLVGGGGKEKQMRRDNNADDVIAGCDWDIKIDLVAFWKEIKRIRKNEHTPCIMFCTTRYGYELIKSNEKEYRYDLVWNKSRGVGFLSANKQPLRSHEMIYVFSKAGANYNRVDIEGDFPPYVGSHSASKVYKLDKPKLEGYKKVDSNKRCVKSVIDVNNESNKKGHPTQKPLLLYKFLIERYSNSGDTVLDPTFGSGNSGLACVELKRRYVGIEKNSDYYWKFVSKIVSGEKK